MGRQSRIKKFRRFLKSHGVKAPLWVARAMRRERRTEQQWQKIAGYRVVDGVPIVKTRVTRGMYAKEAPQVDELKEA